MSQFSLQSIPQSIRHLLNEGDPNPLPSEQQVSLRSVFPATSYCQSSQDQHSGFSHMVHGYNHTDLAAGITRWSKGSIGGQTTIYSALSDQVFSNAPALHRAETPPSIEITPTTVFGRRERIAQALTIHDEYLGFQWSSIEWRRLKQHPAADSLTPQNFTICAKKAFLEACERLPVALAVICLPLEQDTNSSTIYVNVRNTQYPRNAAEYLGSRHGTFTPVEVELRPVQASNITEGLSERAIIRGITKAFPEQTIQWHWGAKKAARTAFEEVYHLTKPRDVCCDIVSLQMASDGSGITARWKGRDDEQEEYTHLFNYSIHMA